LFRKNSYGNITIPEEMSPLESVTHLFAAVQLSDGQTGYEERVSWFKAISELFPEHSEQRAERFLKEAYNMLNSKNSKDREGYIIKLLDRIKVLMPKGEIKKLCLKISRLIEADGIVMSSEIEIVQLISSHLGIKIHTDN
tara:strand:+ start:20332 stop:20751 length:420 start_codon:yes stop_codon:yes gene_type:complete